MAHLRRTLPGVKALAAAAVAAMTLLPLAASAAAAAPAPGATRTTAAVSLAAINDGQNYVLAPQHAPDQWLGEYAWNHIGTQASRMWYGNSYHNALWTAHTVNGAVELQNLGNAGQGLEDDHGAVEANWGHGNTWEWVTVAGPGGTVALQNRATGRYLALVGNAAVMATTAFYWFVVNAHP